MNQEDSLVVKAFNALQLGVGAAADKLSDPALSPGDLCQLSTQLYQLGDLVDDLRDTAKRRIRELVVKLGRVTTEAGSKQLQAEGYTLEIRPTRTGIDPKKLEKLLRAKSLPVHTYMESVVTYKYNEERANHALINGHMTQDELNTCKYDESWAVQQPRRTE